MIKTWQERIEDNGNMAQFPNAMQAEIDELRAALQAQPVQEPAIKQIAKEAQKHGLTLLKTADGFAFMKLGTVTAQAETAPQPVQSPKGAKP